MTESKTHMIQQHKAGQWIFESGTYSEDMSRTVWKILTYLALDLNYRVVDQNSKPMEAAWYSKKKARLCQR